MTDRVIEQVPHDPRHSFRTGSHHHPSRRVQSDLDISFDRDRMHHLDCLICHISEIRMHPLDLNVTSLYPGQEEKVIDEGMEYGQVTLERCVEALRIRCNTVSERLDSCLSRCKRGPQIMADCREELTPSLVFDSPIFICLLQFLGHVIYAIGQLSDFVGTRYTGTGHQVSVGNSAGRVRHLREIVGQGLACRQSKR